MDADDDIELSVRRSKNPTMLLPLLRWVIYCGRHESWDGVGLRRFRQSMSEEEEGIEGSKCANGCLGIKGSRVASTTGVMTTNNDGGASSLADEDDDDEIICARVKEEIHLPVLLNLVLVALLWVCSPRPRDSASTRRPRGKFPPEAQLTLSTMLWRLAPVGRAERSGQVQKRAAHVVSSSASESLGAAGSREAGGFKLHGRMR